MPTSPKITFKFENENVQTSLPTLGISSVVARTTKGPFNQPDEVITSLTRFREIYGAEVVPDGSVSNIERALKTGSSIRVSRVAGAIEPTKGIARSYIPVTKEKGTEPVELTLTVFDSTEEIADAVEFVLNINTREMGSGIVNPNKEGVNANFFAVLSSKLSGSNVKYYLTQFTRYKADGTMDPSTIISNNLLLSSTLENSTNPFVDGASLESFINLCPNIELVFKSSTDDTVKTLQDIVNYLKTNPKYVCEIVTANAPDTSGYTKIADYIINEGTNGGASTSTQWIEAAEATREYIEAYQLILSHVHQHIPLEYTAAYKSVASFVVSDFESLLYVEVPKYNADGNPATPLEIKAMAETLVSTVGPNKAICFFCGGIKLYDDNGALQNCDVLGTVLGLGDSAATAFGPYYSFSGMNRGLVPDSVGPVVKNLGSPTMYDTLNQLAEASLNLFVIKNTPTAGRQTMLWHGFTSEVLDNSNKFIASNRLQLFLKKNIRPIIDKYIEEPNYIPTWSNIFYEVRPILDNLLNIAYSEYTWMGDQNATGYADMQINSEADVRAGKYKAKMRYKDIVSLQEVEITFTVDGVTRDITIE